MAVDSSRGYRLRASGSASNSLFIAKLDPSTSQTVYTTIIQETGAGNSIAVDGNGQAYVGGYIFTMFSYTTFPLVNPLQSTFVPHSNTGFVLKPTRGGQCSAIFHVLRRIRSQHRQGHHRRRQWERLHCRRDQSGRLPGGQRLPKLPVER